MVHRKPKFGSIQERLALLTCFAGAVCAQHGTCVLEEWVNRMINYQHPNDGESEDEQDESIVLRPAKRSKTATDTIRASPSMGMMSWAFEYSTEGPPHALTWRATCIGTHK